MTYALSDDLVIRREWFGCLCYQPNNGFFWQFNEDAFEILRYLKKPLTVHELMRALNLNGMNIEEHVIADFLIEYQRQGLIRQDNEEPHVLFFNENEEFSRTNCLFSPSSVTIYITDYCPKSCRHCATNSHPKIDQSQELRKDDWLRVIERLRQAGVLILVLSGGEPLSFPGINEVIRHADDLNFGINLLTDYDDITEHQIGNLATLKHPVTVQTSIDGARPETHDFLRGKESFHKTLRRLRMLSEAGIKYMVSVSVHKKNIDELEEIANLVYDCGASYIYLNAVAPYGRAKKTMTDYLLTDSDLKLMAQQCLKWAAGNTIQMRNPFWMENLNRIGDETFHPFDGTLNAMSLGIYNLTINSKGMCYLDAKQRAEDMLCLGNIQWNDLHDMWTDPRLDKLRELARFEEFTYSNQSNLEEAVLPSSI